MIGPNQIKKEFKDYLYFKSIRNILYIGISRLASAIYDKLTAIDAGLKKLKSGGPWFVYGLENDEMASLLDNPKKTDDILQAVNR